MFKYLIYITTFMKISEKAFNKKFIETFIQIRHQIDKDKMIYGDSFIRFTDRSIEVISPDKVILKIKNKKIKT